MVQSFFLEDPSMPTIVNLSSLHTLYPLSKTVAAFAQICNDAEFHRERPVGCLSSCSSFFKSATNYAWVMYQYETRYNLLIAPYKSGKINTYQFIKNLRKIFTFVDEFDTQLLMDAWNVIVGMEPDKVARFEKIVNEASAENPVYLISNTNELNVDAILTLVRDKTSIHLEEGINIGVKLDQRPIQMAPHVYLCLSYRYQLFKTAEQTEAEITNLNCLVSLLDPLCNLFKPGGQSAADDLHSTASLMRHLFEHELKEMDRAQIQVISPFPGDLKEAIRLGATDVVAADDYFAPPTAELRKAY